MLKNGQRVSLEYTVFLEDGTKVDTNVGEDPLVFVLGNNQVFPALEQALLGLRVGDAKKVVLTADQAYGPVVPDAFREVDLEHVPEPLRKEGSILGLQDPSGGVYPVRVHAIKGSKAVLDFNHPLAGRSLTFAVKVVSIGEE